MKINVEFINQANKKKPKENLVIFIKSSST